MLGGGASTVLGGGASTVLGGGASTVLGGGASTVIGAGASRVVIGGGAVVVVAGGGIEEVGTTAGRTGVAGCWGHPNLNASAAISATNTSTPDTSAPARRGRNEEPGGSAGAARSGELEAGSVPDPSVGGGGGEDNGSESTVNPAPLDRPWPPIPAGTAVTAELPGAPGRAVSARGAP